MTLQATYGSFAGPLEGTPVTVGDHDGTPVVLDVVVDGPADGEPVLLAAGLGMQRTGWSPRLLDGLHAAGYRTVTADNRDVGRATVLPGEVADLPRGADGWPVAPYGLADLAADLVTVLDQVGVDGRCHVVGISMGGMIAQHVALGTPRRVASLTSLMSMTGAADTGQTHASVRWVLTTPAPVADPDAYVEHALAVARAVGSPGRVDEDAVRARAAVEFARGVHPQGTARQLLAIRGDGDRTARLGAVAAPTLVVHGDRDPLIDVSGGAATAAAIAGSRLEVVAGLGHDLPDAFVDARVLPLLVDHLRAAPIA
ncbi:alpha/beta fold hydrolase [Egicoccus halophilus]|uniref:Alpha/beta hydrolase n=1 Tax=Egicoccus halophilus TaxID=1670830 RepID=A0A8J3A8S1_9ACTN|nr:alpha/beta fold hydrolase [Egicoccus halophilus]GGI06861.1 alpha/beta hydrolase [Egicoccus halophilus]